MEGLTQGRIVHYVLTEEDAGKINRRRIVSGVVSNPNWPAGAQAHVGNYVEPGDHYPAIVVMTYTNASHDRGTVNLQVFLDGSDTFWAEVIDFGEEPGTWHWIEKA